MSTIRFALSALAALSLVACNQAEAPAAEEAAANTATAADDDNDAAAPVAAPKAEEEPHDESVPHEH